MPGRRRIRDDRRNPAGGVRLVVVDGRNVQFALRRATSGDLPDTALIARLRAALAGLETRLILDGHPAGSPQGRIAPGFAVEFGRHRDADSVIGDIVVEGARELGPAGVDSILVVTDDRAVREHSRRQGARVAATSWLVARVERIDRGLGTGPGQAKPGASIGHAGPPRPPRSPRHARDR